MILKIAYLQLIKYKRISESEWEETSLLPVQFASLITSEKAEIADRLIEIRMLYNFFIKGDNPLCV